MEEDAPAGVPEWVVTFGDMMSLLLTFFIMLVSMSEMKSEQRVAEAVEALRKRFGADPEHRPGAAKLRGARVNAPLGPQARVRAIRTGERVQIGAAAYFAHGGIELTDEQREVLTAVLPELQGKPQKIEIRGHTSRSPLDDATTTLDQWDLAYDRCRQVMDFLVAQGIEPRRIRLGVAANNEPTHLGDDPLLCKENDRVEVFMLNEISDDYEQPALGGVPIKPLLPIP